MIKESNDPNASISPKAAHLKYMKYCQDHDIRGKSVSKEELRDMISSVLGTQMMTQSRANWKGYEFTDIPYTPPPAVIASATRYRFIIENLLDTDFNSLKEGHLDVRLLVCPAPLSNKGMLSENSFNNYLSRLRVMQEVTAEFRPESEKETEFDYTALSFIMLHPKETLLALKQKRNSTYSSLAGFASVICKLFRCHPWAMKELEASFVIWNKYFVHYQSKAFEYNEQTVDKALNI